MKALLAMTMLLFFLVSCGGGRDSLSANTRPTATGFKEPAFETPPSPGVNR